MVNLKQDLCQEQTLLPIHAKSIQPFIPVKGTFTLPFPTVYPLIQNHLTLHGRTLLKDLQLPLGNRELREAAMQADHELRKDPHDKFVQTFESGEMDATSPLNVLCFSEWHPLQATVSLLSSG